jgi:hypothetical protein
MDWYYYIALAAIISQLLFLLQTYNNYRYALAKSYNIEQLIDSIVPLVSIS